MRRKGLLTPLLLLTTIGIALMGSVMAYTAPNKLRLSAKSPGSTTTSSTSTSAVQGGDANSESGSSSPSQQRRAFFTSAVSACGCLCWVASPSFMAPSAAQAQVTRAVGTGELACRQQGNCLQVGELDGALGWTWGGRERCDPSDPLCSASGKLLEEPLLGKPVPQVPQTVVFTHVAAIQIEIGRGEVGVLKLGLYGNEAPVLVQELLDFLSENGLTTGSSASQRNIGAIQTPVSLATGGLLTGIVPSTTIELGVPSQANAYARSRGKSKAGDDFIPQPRPKPLDLNAIQVVRPHDRAGLVSVPALGLGYGGTGFESDDQAFESAIVVTDTAVPDFDKKNQRLVVGQVLDSGSMAFLERLANLPTKRGIRGVIPGQTSGPPLPKVVVRQVQISKVTAPVR